ncbi:MAG: TIGR02757 family protein [Chitinispirillaceae bacterium]|nr:TIGR02757 family protein [Chitinispirillaceae bacterium]
MTSGKEKRLFEGVEKRIRLTYARYHRPEYLAIDPLMTVRDLQSRMDREIGGFIAAVLSYGRVEVIIRKVKDLFTAMKRRPAEFVFTTDFAAKRRALRGFKHRFTDGDDLALLLEAVASLARDAGSMEPPLRQALDTSESGMRGALACFSETICCRAAEIAPEINDNFFFLIPTPASGSACKRLNMFLRWMVRPDDGIDLGAWKSIPAAALIVPVDTHIAKIARSERMTNRASADWRMAEEITACLRRIDPFDPVRFDFSLCRLGMTTVRKDAA